jgi:hypothetical protein
MAWKNHKPPSGIPAKGAGVGDARAFTGSEGIKIGADRQPPGIHKSIGRMEAKEYRELLRAKLARAAAAYDRALDGDNPQLAVVAAKQIEDRVFGQAKQVVETQETTPTRDELLAEIEAAKKAAGID